MTIDLTILLVAWQLSRLMTSHPDVKERERDGARETLLKVFNFNAFLHAELDFFFFFFFFAVYWKCMGFEQLREKGLFCVENIFLQSCNPCMY